MTHSAGLPDCLDALKGDWDRLQAETKDWNARNDRFKRGVGIACMWYGCGNTSLSNPSTMRITLDQQGKVTFFNGAVDIGRGPPLFWHRSRRMQRACRFLPCPWWWGTRP